MLRWDGAAKWAPAMYMYESGEARGDRFTSDLGPLCLDSVLLSL